MHGVRVAEQIVQVAKDFLIRTNQKHAKIIRGSVILMQHDRTTYVAAVDELIDFAVRVTGDIAEDRMSRWSAI